MKDEDFADLMASVAEARAFARGDDVASLHANQFTANEIPATKGKELPRK